MNDKGLILKTERFNEARRMSEAVGLAANSFVVVENRQQPVTNSNEDLLWTGFPAFHSSVSIPNPTTNAAFFQPPSNCVKKANNRAQRAREHHEKRHTKANKLAVELNRVAAFRQYHFGGIVTGYGCFNSIGRAMSINNSTHNEYAIPQYVICCSSAVNCCNRKRLLKYNGCFNILDRGKKRKCLICNKIVSQAVKSAPSWPGQKYGVSVAEQGLAGFLSYRYWNK